MSKGWIALGRRWIALALALACHGAAAQTYPTRPIKIVVPATPGGAIDLIARSLAEKMSAPLGQPVIVENKPGAANNLGTDFVAKSPPDGYTLVIVASSHATNKWLYKNLPYDPVKDFEPVDVHARRAAPSRGASFGGREERAGARRPGSSANPDKAAYASSGPGSSLHMAAELFMSMTKHEDAARARTRAARRRIRISSPAAPR